MRGEDCRFAILNFLYKQEKASFEQIMKKVGAARRTANNYLRELYNEKPYRLVDKEYGKRGKYYLTKEGKTEAERQLRLKEIIKKSEKLPHLILKELEEEAERLQGLSMRHQAALETSYKTWSELVKYIGEGLEAKEIIFDNKKTLTKYLQHNPILITAWSDMAGGKKRLIKAFERIPDAPLYRIERKQVNGDVIMNINIMKSRGTPEEKRNINFTKLLQETG